MTSAFVADIKQTFAIGNVAWVLATLFDGPTPRMEIPKVASAMFVDAGATGVAVEAGSLRHYVFGTDTTLGLKVGLAAESGVSPRTVERVLATSFSRAMCSRRSRK